VIARFYSLEYAIWSMMFCIFEYNCVVFLGKEKR